MEIPHQIVKLVDEYLAAEVELDALNNTRTGRDLSPESARLGVIALAVIRERERLRLRVRRAKRRQDRRGSATPADGRSSRVGAA